MGTPASISARVEPQTLPIELDPLELTTSETTLTVYANSSSSGITCSSERSTSAPWPMSRRLGPRMGFVSPVL